MLHKVGSCHCMMLDIPEFYKVLNHRVLLLLLLGTQR